MYFSFLFSLKILTLCSQLKYVERDAMPNVLQSGPGTNSCSMKAYGPQQAHRGHFNV